MIGFICYLYRIIECAHTSIFLSFTQNNIDWGAKITQKYYCVCRQWTYSILWPANVHANHMNDQLDVKYRTDENDRLVARRIYFEFQMHSNRTDRKKLSYEGIDEMNEKKTWIDEPNQNYGNETNKSDDDSLCERNQKFRFTTCTFYDCPCVCVFSGE